jgi:hypothetical protein
MYSIEAQINIERFKKNFPREYKENKIIENEWNAHVVLAHPGA